MVETWRPDAGMLIEQPGKRTDFLSFGTDALMMTESTKQVVAPLLQPYGEFLPVSLENEPGSFYLFNVTNVRPVIETSTTRLEYEMKRHLNAQDGSVMIVKDAGFPSPIFFFDNDAGTANAFLRLYREKKLTGLDFRERWKG